MKFAIMMGATILGVWLGIGWWKRGANGGYPGWWKTLCIVTITVTLVLGIWPPTAGTVTDAVTASRMDSEIVVPVLLRPADGGLWADARDSRVIIQVDNIVSDTHGDYQTAVVEVRRLTDTHFRGVRTVATDPVLTMPYITGLAERARIIFFHVPMSWVATVAYLVAMIFGIRYLRTRNLDYDHASMSMIAVATLYGILATITGAVWARFNWGMFWNWDPKQTAIFLVLLIYGAYFLLRSSVQDPHQRARLSGAYSILGFVAVPFLFFILPRMMPGLHPGSSDDTGAGPLLSAKSDAINVTKQWVFGLALFSFTLLFFWLSNVRFRIAKLLHTSSSVHP